MDQSPRWELAALYGTGTVLVGSFGIVPPTDINALLERQIAGRSFGVFGEPRVNVLDLNLALQRAYPRPR